MDENTKDDMNIAAQKAVSSPEDSQSVSRIFFNPGGSPTRGEALLDLFLTNTIRKVKIGNSLGHSDHVLVEFTILRDMAQMKSRVRMLNFRKRSFHFFKELVAGTP